MFSEELDHLNHEVIHKNDLLMDLSMKDALTGIPNTRAFYERIEEIVAGSARTMAPCGLIMLDIDRFKSMNDTFGHQAGDQTLKQVGSILKNSARAGEFVARYGGEEFVVILPGATGAASSAAAERLRKNLETAEWPYREITASFGVSALEPGMLAADLVRDADEAMYASKNGGRNLVTHISELRNPTPLPAVEIDRAEI